jgi:DNA-binding CsgD family transcriptional regulator
MAAGIDRPIVCPVLIGREAQVAALDGLIEAAARGAGQALLVAGEAGIGKSRLVAAARERALARDFLLLQGHCFQPDSACPYAPVLDLLRSHLGGQPPAAVAAELGAAAPAVAPLLPELLPAPAASMAPLDPEQAKRRLFAALAQYLLQQTARRPVLLVIEDLHWSDDTSLEFLHHLLRHAAAHRLLALLTYRPDDQRPALRHWLAGLDRERLAQELTLGPLTPAEVDGMMRAIFGLPQPARAEFLEAICALTQGNPFFVEEVLKSLVANGEVFLRDGVWSRKPMDQLRIPRSIQDAVQTRLTGLSAPAQRLVRIAAVAGRRFDFTLLQTVTRFDEAALLELIRELIEAQLVVEESADHFAFRHELTRQVIYGDLLARERRALHGVLAAAVERGAPDAVEARVADLAYHAYAAGDWPKALAYGQRAGGRARALYAPAAAVEHLSHAIEAARQLGQRPPADLCRMRGQAYDTLGDFAAAADDYAAALAAARATGDRAAEWQVLLDLGLLWTGRDYEEAHRYLQAALALARVLGDPATLAHSLNRMGNWYANHEQPEPARQQHEEALAIFERLGDRAGLAATLDLLSMAHALGGDLVGASRAGRQAADLFRALGDRQGLIGSLVTSLLPGAVYEFDVMVGSASLGEGISFVEEALALARETGWRSGEAFVMAILGECYGAAGEFARGLTLARGSLAIAEELEHHQWMAQAHWVLGALHADLAALPAARRHFEQALALGRALNSRVWFGSATAGLAAVLIRQGEPAQAEAVLAAALSPGAPVQTQAQRQLWCTRAELALAAGDCAAALDILDRLYATAANLTAEGDIARLAWLKAQALAGLGQAEPADALLRAAQATAASQGARSMLWRLHAARGALLRGQGRVEEAEGEEGAARRLIEELARNVPAGELRDGFRRAALATLPASVAPRPRPAGGLTRREWEVAGLIAQGKTNREIAEALSVGERTVETHVSNMLMKLGFASRAQIAAWAATRGQR